jgi:hypothetical protein
LWEKTAGITALGEMDDDVRQQKGSHEALAGLDLQARFCSGIAAAPVLIQWLYIRHYANPLR